LSVSNMPTWTRDPQAMRLQKLHFALRSNLEKFRQQLLREYNDFGTPRLEPDWDETRIEVDEIKKWLSSRGIKTGFFFSDESTGPEYLDPNHDHYAPKLAAAIHAWETVNSDPNLRKGKTPKQALEIWLRAHGNDFGLTKDDGNPNETGIQEVSKIANWETKGGAPRTNG
jgi:hypothetical protein